MLDQVRNLIRRLGVEITRFPPPTSMAWMLDRLITRRRIERVIDVGAHEGGFMHLLRDLVRFDGDAISFEPSSASHAKLIAAFAADSHWTCHQMALGATSGTLELNVFSSTDFNSFLRPNQYGADRFGGLPQLSTESVEVRRLDEILESGPQTLLKIDTQGFDLEVLAGSNGVLPSVEAVLLEVPVRQIYDGAPGISEIIERLSDLGYLLSAAVPVSRDADGLTVIEFDGLFIRPESPARP